MFYETFFIWKHHDHMLQTMTKYKMTKTPIHSFFSQCTLRLINERRQIDVLSDVVSMYVQMVYFQPLVVMKSSTYLTTMYNYYNMEHNKDEYGTCTFGKSQKPMQKGKVTWSSSPMLVKSSSRPKWNYQAPRWLFPPMAPNIVHGL